MEPTDLELALLISSLGPAARVSLDAARKTNELKASAAETEDFVARILATLVRRIEHHENRAQALAEALENLGHRLEAKGVLSPHELDSLLAPLPTSTRSTSPGSTS